MTRIILITTLYKARDPERIAEFNRCLEINCRGAFDEIVVFFEGRDEENYPALRHPKVTLRRIDECPTFGDFITYANQHHDGDYIVISNGDIYFDEMSCIERVKELKPGQMWALTRYNPPGQKSPNMDFSESYWFLEGSGRHVGYDSYCFISPLNNLDGDIIVGRWGCDTYFVMKAIRVGIAVSNPCLSIKSKHLHKSPERTYFLLPLNYKADIKKFFIEGKFYENSLAYPSTIENLEEERYSLIDYYEWWIRGLINKFFEFFFRKRLIKQKRTKRIRRNKQP